MPSGAPTPQPLGGGMEALMSLLGSADVPKRPKTPLEEALERLIFGEGNEAYQALLPGGQNTGGGSLPMVQGAARGRAAL